MGVSRTSRIFYGLILGYGYQLTVMVVGLWLTPVLLRLLGTADLGKWLVVGQVLSLLSLLDLGVTAILGREVAKANGADPVHGVPEVVRRATWLVGYQTPVVAAFAGIAWWASTLGRPEIAWPLGLVLVVFVLCFPARLFGACLMGMQDLSFSGVLQALTWGTTTAFTIALVFTGHGLNALAIGWAIGQGVGAVVGYVRLRWRFPHVFAWSGRPAWSLLRAYLVSSLWASLYQLSTFFSLGSDLLVVGGVLGSEAVVAYNCTNKLPGIAMGLLSVIMTGSFPALAELRGGASPSRYWQATRAVGLTLLLLSGGMALALTGMNAAFVGRWVGPRQFAGPLVSGACVAVMVFRHYVLTFSGPGYTLGHDRRLALMALTEGLVTVVSMIGWTLLLGPVGVPLGPITGVGLVTLPVAVTLIASAAEVPWWQVLGWSAPWVVRFAAVYIPLGFAVFLLPVEIPWVAGVLTAGALLVYALLMLPLLDRDPLRAYQPGPLRTIRGYLRRQPEADTVLLESSCPSSATR